MKSRLSLKYGFSFLLGFVFIFGFAGYFYLNSSIQIGDSSTSSSFFYPIGVDFANPTNPKVKFCPLRFDVYRKNPSRFPMFKDLVAYSCNSSNTYTRSMSDVEKEVELYEEELRKLKYQHKQGQLTETEEPAPEEQQQQQEQEQLTETEDEVKIVQLHDKLQEVVDARMHGGSRRVLEEKEEILVPSGFIFHESRCGSTLAANMLGVTGEAGDVVFSESSPPSEIINCRGCTDADKIKYLRIVMKSMILSSYIDTTPESSSPPTPFSPSSPPATLRQGPPWLHNKARGLTRFGSFRYREGKSWFKFQSVITLNIQYVLTAFPETPWIFLFRQPVQVMMSHLSARSVAQNSAPCLRSRKHSEPPKELKNIITSIPPVTKNLRDVSPSRWCAAHLETLCRSAISAVTGEVSPYASEHSIRGVFGKERANNTRGVLVEYTALPQLFPQILAVHFGVLPSERAVEKMMDAAKLYSKSRDDSQEIFESDSQEKEEAASEEVKRWGGHYLDQSYQFMHDSFIKFLSQSAIPAQLDGSEPTNSLKSTLTLKNGNVIPVKDPDLVPLMDLLNEWSPNDWQIPNIPNIATGTIQRFDFQEDYEAALHFRDMEIPFVLTNVPDVDMAKVKWTDEYLIEKFGKHQHQVTVSTSNSFMYYDRKQASRVGRSYKPPTTTEPLTFKQWLDKVHYFQPPHPFPNETHHYFLASSPRPSHDKWIAKDLKIFDPIKSFWMVDPSRNRGINCRFGMPGIKAEAHYDGGRNYIAMLRGAKRYVILPPNYCPNLYLYPRGHPEARHSSLDWAAPDPKKHPLFYEARATQIILRAGEVLYLPSYWFHYIVSLGPDISAQCNSRSGEAERFRLDLVECGFYTDADNARRFYIPWTIVAFICAGAVVAFIVFLCWLVEEYPAIRPYCPCCAYPEHSSHTGPKVVKGRVQKGRKLEENEGVAKKGSDKASRIEINNFASGFGSKPSTIAVCAGKSIADKV